jgi:hypothetical protein
VTGGYLPNTPEVLSSITSTTRKTNKRKATTTKHNKKGEEKGGVYWE